LTGKPTLLSNVETTAGWVKSPNNPVLGGSLGTCFDVCLLKEQGIYRMWFSWRPKDSIAYVESADGISWGEPIIALGPDTTTQWEDRVNRPIVVKRQNEYQMWYTGQIKGQSRIGYATSPDGRTWTRASLETGVIARTRVGESSSYGSPRELEPDKRAIRYVVFWG